MQRVGFGARRRLAMKTGWLFLQALVALAAFDLILLAGKFRTVHRIVRRWKVADKNVAEGSVERIIKAVNLPCMLYPKQTLCFQRSSATVFLLRKHGVQPDFFLGSHTLPFHVQ